MPNQSDETKLALLQNDVTYIKEKLNAVVSREEFDPVRKIVYGVVTLILIGVVGALVALVVGAK